jgi:regulation of enolase protein 1 (concanavalin A-like superfamily)
MNHQLQKIAVLALLNAVVMAEYAPRASCVENRVVAKDTLPTARLTSVEPVSKAVEASRPLEAVKAVEASKTVKSSRPAEKDPAKSKNAAKKEKTAAEKDTTDAKDAADAKNIVPGWGQFHDVVGDCQYRLEEGVLTIEVPGAAHDLSVEQGQMTAPAVLQEVRGDFKIVVKVDGQFTPGRPLVPGRPAYQGAGLVLALNLNNYIRLERGTFIQPGAPQSPPYANFEVRLNGQVVRIGQTTDFTLTEGRPTYFKIEKQGESILGFVSEDGKQWYALGEKNLPPSEKLMVGVAAINASDAPLTPQFSEHKLTNEPGANSANAP